MRKTKRLFVANWKENKEFSEGVKDFIELVMELEAKSYFNKEIVICPPFPFLGIFSEIIEKNGWRGKVKLGSQDVSRYETGEYTGEVSVRLLKGVVEYAIIGHPERRKYFKETDEAVNDKIRLCSKFGVIPITCVSNEDEVRSLILPEGVTYVAFEPENAISKDGVGSPESPDSVLKFYRQFNPDFWERVGFLYGGSLNSQNIASFLNIHEIEGFLIGNASLQPTEFYHLVSLS